jgi:hypothetical protein
MEINEFKKYTNNIDAFHPSEIEFFRFMSDDELKEYQHELEYDTGNLSNWDHVRALFTLKHKIAK